MKAGKLNRRVVIEAQTITTDDMGALLETWAPLREVWASVVRQIPNNNSEAMYSGAVRAPAMYKVIIRWLSTKLLEGGHRINMEGRILDITSVDDITDEGRSITLVCQEGMTNG